MNDAFSYWDQWYSARKAPRRESQFAAWVQKSYLRGTDAILELGCGNGRDSFYFLQHGHTLLALDGSSTAIERNTDRLGRSDVFHCIDFADLQSFTHNKLADISIVYSRFVLHAVPDDVESIMLDFMARVLPAGGRMMHEFRTIRDPLAQKGENLGGTERFTDHYRRFIDPFTLVTKIRSRGFRIEFFAEGHGFAVLGDDDPVVARLVAVKDA